MRDGGLTVIGLLDKVHKLLVEFLVGKRPGGVGLGSHGEVAVRVP